MLSRGFRSRCHSSNSACRASASFQWFSLRTLDECLRWSGSIRFPSRHNEARAWILLLLMPGDSGAVKGKGIHCRLSSGSLISGMGREGGCGRKRLLLKLRVWDLSRSAHTCDPSRFSRHSPMMCVDRPRKVCSLFGHFRIGVSIRAVCVNFGE